MIELLSMLAEEINGFHLELLVDSKVPEGEQIEFKEGLPAKGDDTLDPWMSGEDRIGDRARNKILEEVTAFANAHGGALFLGIKESDEKPAVADEISPVPRCEELAERLKLVFRDCVEPQLPRLEIFAVPVKGREGIVIIRVGRSRLAPHRVTKTLVCPIRRSDRCEKMTMREIQDMTLNVARGLERLDKRFSERHERFQQEFECLQTPADALGIRFTAMPIGDKIRFDRVFRHRTIVSELDEPWHEISIEQDNGEPYVLNNMRTFLGGVRCRPMLRATREESDWGADNMERLYNGYRELHCDGLIEIGFVSGIHHNHLTDNLFLHEHFPIIIFANLAVWAVRIRKQASVPTAEYAIEGEIRVIGTPAVVADNANYPILGNATILEPDSVEFPRYSLGDCNEISDLIALFYRDFRNSLSKDIDTEGFAFAIKDWPDD